jgi:hypothetical protein
MRVWNALDSLDVLDALDALDAPLNELNECWKRPRFIVLYITVSDDTMTVFG